MPNTSGSADLEAVAGLDISQHRCAKLKSAVIITARLRVVVNERVGFSMLMMMSRSKWTQVRDRDGPVNMGLTRDPCLNQGEPVRLYTGA